MAAHFTCSAKGFATDDLVRSQYKTPPLHTLKETLGNLSFIGLQEAYHESLCLFKIQRYGIFPDECDCNTKLATQNETHMDWGVKQHHVSDYGEDTWAKVDFL